MQKRTLTILPTSLLALGLLSLGLLALLRPHPVVSRVEATKVEASANPEVNHSINAEEAVPDVSVNGQHVTVPANGTVSTGLSGGGQVQVTTSHSGSSGASASPDSSLNVSTRVESNNQSTSNTNLQVFSHSTTQVSNWSNDHVFSTGTSTVNVTH